MIDKDELMSLIPSSSKQIAEGFLQRGDCQGFLEEFHHDPWDTLCAFARRGSCDDQLPRLFADVWIASDEWPEHSVIEFLVSKIRATCPKVFNLEDNATFDALPQQVTIYRGFRGRNKRNRCWTLSREKAIWFAQIALLHNGCAQAVPRIGTLTIPKADILFFTNAREEQEVVLTVPQRSTRLTVIQEAPHGR